MAKKQCLRSICCLLLLPVAAACCGDNGRGESLIAAHHLEPYGATEGHGSANLGHSGQGLAFKHGNRLQGFAVAGEDKAFHWADAVIDGDTVVLSSTAVAKPVAVRYGWSSKRAWANLFNKDGLPAVPFRTDDW